MKITLKQIVPAAGRSRLRRAINSIADRLEPGIPPRHLRSHISPLWLDFKASGRDQLEFCIELAGLNPHDRVLDIASGVGRFCLPLTQYLETPGSYEGFDIFTDGIRWCQTHITEEYPNFRFTDADVASPWAPDRTFTSATYRFPYDTASFDFAYAGSLFTHLVEDGARNYLNEVAAALKPGGRFVCTWLLFNSASAEVLSGKSMNKIWDKKCGTHRTIARSVPESSVLYEESSVRSWYSEAGLRIIEPIRFDATYCPSRIPDDRSKGMHLYYSHSIIAVKQS